MTPYELDMRSWVICILNLLIMTSHACTITGAKHAYAILARLKPGIQTNYVYRARLVLAVYSYVSAINIDLIKIIVLNYLLWQPPPL